MCSIPGLVLRPFEGLRNLFDRPVSTSQGLPPTSAPQTYLQPASRKDSSALRLAFWLTRTAVGLRAIASDFFLARPPGATPPPHAFLSAAGECASRRLWQRGGTPKLRNGGEENAAPSATRLRARRVGKRLEISSQTASRSSTPGVARQRPRESAGRATEELAPQRAPRSRRLPHCRRLRRSRLGGPLLTRTPERPSLPTSGRD